jgi:uroporphyrinogen III methyltransferase/synthase
VTVHLVGAGPGDPGLITVRGAELLASAEVVIHDRLTAAELLDLVPAGAEVIHVGKDPAGRSVPQEHINDLLVEHGRSGREVVRLKGGDPFVFARGAEEAAALAAAGVPYEVVPGITSALAAPATAGIPVTMRYSSTSVTVVTGHEDPTKGPSQVDWEAIAAVGGTIVVLMGVGRWASIAERLLAGGLAPDTPAAAVRWGTTPVQSTVRATLATLGRHRLAAPSVIVVGDVAAQHLDWFESRPLFGRSVVVTRARAQAGELASRLARLGADVVAAPTIEVTDPLDGGSSLDAAITRLGSYDWVVLTSANGVVRFCSRLRDGRDLAGVRIAAIGPGTAAALARHHLVADLVPDRFVAESLLEAFPAPPQDRAGRVLLARAEVAREVLPEGLAAMGWEVDVASAYRTVPAVVDEAARDRVARADAVCFTSASTVENFVAAFGAEAAPSVVAAIGPVTAAAARRGGLAVDVEADPHTLDGLVGALAAHLFRPGLSEGPPGGPSEAPPGRASP